MDDATSSARLGQIKEEEMMVIQSYDVKTTSQRTFLSVESTTMLATRQLQLARNAWGLPPAPPPQNSQNSQGNQNSQGSQGNQNSQGSQGAQGNQNSQGSQGAQGNQNSQGAQGNQNSQGQDEDNVTISDRSTRRRRQNQLKQMLESIRNESISQLAQKTSSSHFSKVRFARKETKLPSNPQELKAHLLQLMLELLGGKRTDQKPAPEADNGGRPPEMSMHGFQRGRFGVSNFFLNMFGDDAQRFQRVDGWRVEHFQYESEQVSYQAKGVVHTADGRTINVDINMFMSREFVSYMGIDVEATRPVDPLVINYGGTASSLMGDRFQFDLTMDGNLDSLAVLGEGSGFLAVDWNGDGKINDGSELFGPSTGCGFSEPRKFDTDGNGWIDANDEIFDKLVVWHRDKDGNDTVFTLKELGIGAIYLGDIETEFSFKDETNQTLGIMRSTSFFLKECGGAGTLSHIDMMI